jgi:hypothetical protein
VSVHANWCAGLLLVIFAQNDHGHISSLYNKLDDVLILNFFVDVIFTCVLILFECFDGIHTFNYRLLLICATFVPASVLLSSAFSFKLTVNYFYSDV